MFKLIKGKGSVNTIAREITGMGYDSVFLIIGNHFYKKNDFSFLLKISFDFFLKSGQNVNEAEAEKAFEQFRGSKKKVIIAIGGGSVMDIAKYIIYRLIESSLPLPYFIAVPTTAGSGSEATHFAVIFKGKKKFSLAHPSLLPQLAVLDPLLTYSLPAYQTAVSGMDAFAQAVESYWNLNATDESKKYAIESILGWKDFFIKCVVESRPHAREVMLQAAHLAGKAINITKTTGPHALSYYLTANHNVPHGLATSLFLPLFFLYNKPQTDLCNLLNVKDESEAGEMIRQIMKQAGLAISFAELGIDKGKIMDELLNDVNEERFANNPVKFDRGKLKKLISDYL
jgi:alcohol dehydrogenase